jgi:hypothetical protein
MRDSAAEQQSSSVQVSGARTPTEELGAVTGHESPRERYERIQRDIDRLRERAAAELERAAEAMATRATTHRRRRVALMEEHRAVIAALAQVLTKLCRKGRAGYSEGRRRAAAEPGEGVAGAEGGGGAALPPSSVGWPRRSATAPPPISSECWCGAATTISSSREREEAACER